MGVPEILNWQLCAVPVRNQLDTAWLGHPISWDRWPDGPCMLLFSARLCFDIRKEGPRMADDTKGCHFHKRSLICRTFSPVGNIEYHVTYGEWGDGRQFWRFFSVLRSIFYLGDMCIFPSDWHLGFSSIAYSHSERFHFRDENSELKRMSLNIIFLFRDHSLFWVEN